MRRPAAEMFDEPEPVTLVSRAIKAIASESRRRCEEDAGAFTAPVRMTG
jgi:hypothetical protein